MVQCNFGALLGPWRKLLLMIACTLLALLADGEVVVAAVLPHGDFALDPALVHYQNGSLELHLASLRLADMIRSTRPEVIFLCTPHGLAHSSDFLLYQNAKLKGHAWVGNDLHDPAR
eukprot:RCo047200